MKAHTFNREQLQALDLLARGGARYGTRIEVMRGLKELGLCYAHDKGSHLKKGRWTWRPTPKGREIINNMKGPTMSDPQVDAMTAVQVAVPTPKLRERDLYQPVRDWLRSHGWTVFPEVFDADIVAVRGEEIVAVELKLGMREHLNRQLMLCAQWADWVYAAIPAQCYKKTREWSYRGYGALLVDGDKAIQRLKPQRQPRFWHTRHAYRLKKLATRNPACDDDCAGLPSGPERAGIRRRALGLASSKSCAAGRKGG